MREGITVAENKRNATLNKIIYLYKLENRY